MQSPNVTAVVVLLDLSAIRQFSSLSPLLRLQQCVGNPEGSLLGGSNFLIAFLAPKVSL